MLKRVHILVEYGNGDKGGSCRNMWHRAEGPAWEGANGSKAWGLFYKRITKETSILLVL